MNERDALSKLSNYEYKQLAFYRSIPQRGAHMNEIFSPRELAVLAELRVIHAITEDIAGCGPILDTDTVTVRNVKNMAHLINKMAKAGDCNGSA